MPQGRILAAVFNSEVRIEGSGGTMPTANPVSRPAMTAVSPFFIVRDLARALSFYRDGLGFDVAFRAPDPEPFFAIVRRDGVQFLLKVVGPDVAPLPNCQRHPWARWDAYVSVPDPDALSTELASRGVTFSAPIADTDDGLRGFEVLDPDGYALFFGRPR
jgi:catechol 2,3-dioxygenase-like lactoylglutathione lyase family enzyme